MSGESRSTTGLSGLRSKEEFALSASAITTAATIANGQIKCLTGDGFKLSQFADAQRGARLMEAAPPPYLLRG